MEIYNLYFNLLGNPFAIKTYRDLREYYLNRDMLQEANAFSHLIQVRQNHDTTNHSSSGIE